VPESRLGVHHEFDWNFNIPEYRAPDNSNQTRGERPILTRAPVPPIFLPEGKHPRLTPIIAPDSTARKNEAVSLPKTCPSIGEWIVTSQQELAIPTVGQAGCQIANSCWEVTIHSPIEGQVFGKLTASFFLIGRSPRV
jgi:hypothetical protein